MLESDKSRLAKLHGQVDEEDEDSENNNTDDDTLDNDNTDNGTVTSSNGNEDALCAETAKLSVSLSHVARTPKPPGHSILKKSPQKFKDIQE